MIGRGVMQCHAKAGLYFPDCYAYRGMKMCCAQGILACQYSSCKSYHNESVTYASVLCRWARPMMMIQFACYVVWLSAFQIFLLLFQVIFLC